MSNIKYVIRRNEFAYNDEYYETDSPIATKIKAVYTQKSEAETAYKELIINALYNDDNLYGYSVGNRALSDENYQQINNFFIEKTGEPFDAENTISELNSEDAFTFAQLSGVLLYQLIEIDDNQNYYTIWINRRNKYVKVPANDYPYPLFSQHENAIFHQEYEYPYNADEEISAFFDDLPEILEGSLDDLSHSPILLETLINSKNWLIYNNDSQRLTICHYAEEEHFNELKSLNALLIQPLFEIRPVTLEQLAELT